MIIDTDFYIGEWLVTYIFKDNDERKSQIYVCDRPLTIAEWKIKIEEFEGRKIKFVLRYEKLGLTNK